VKQLKVKIIKKDNISDSCFKLSLKSDYLKKTAKPGQFVSVKCSDTTSPLLKRPFGIHKVTSHGIELLIKKAGKATQLLSQKKEGDEIIVLGPLGQGFEIEHKKMTFCL
jgi:dihydroorotate dehydrogenase electron transfer subunit